MKEPVYNNIYSYLKRNNIIVYFFGIILTLVTFFSLLFSYKVFNNSKNLIYGYNGKGNIVPLKLLNSKEDRLEQVKSNLDLFVSYFYNLEQTNYEKKIEKSLWLGGEIVKKIYQQKLSEGYYNQFIQFGIIQKAELIKVKIGNYDEPYEFGAIVHLSLNNNGNIIKYELTIKGTMINVNINYPNNPFGLLINNYTETNVKKIEND